MLLILSFSSTAQPPQYHPDINSLNSLQKNALAIKMEAYITPDIINNYANYRNNISECDNEANFLSFRRSMVEDFEDYLYLNGASQFIPLPAWDPGTLCPAQFQVVDADCSGAECSIPNNWQPHSRTSILNFPSKCLYNPGIGAGSFVEKMSAYTLVGGFDELVNNNMGGNMGGPGNMKGSAATLAFWIYNAYLDDVWKEYMCQCATQNPNPKQVDLFMKNSKKTYSHLRDIGVESNLDPETWNSPDIWVRNDNAGFTTDQMQNPVYSSTVPVSVYVRVRNKGCSNSLGTENLKLYWSKAGTYLNWPAPWDGVPIIGLQMGGLIGTKPVPVLNDGEQTILKFDWFLPNPAQFGQQDFDTDGDGVADSWHFCLLARINASNDADGVNLAGNDMTTILQGSNNFVLRNLAVISFLPNPIIGGTHIDQLNNATIAIGNLFNSPYSFDFQLEATTTDTHPIPITNEAEVIVTLSQSAWQKWVEGGMLGDNIIIYSEDERKLRMTSNMAFIRNLNFEVNELSAINVSFNFLTRELSPETNYEFVASQIRQSDGKVVGGESYIIEKPSRLAFLADAGNNETIQSNQSVNLSANSIGEDALYKWYNPEGDLIHTGKDFSASPEITTQYRLEVIALADGFKDYDQITVHVKDKYLLSISPNPASSNVEIVYKAGNSSSAYLIISQPAGLNNNYILDLNTEEKSINVSSFTSGVYNVILVCDGQVVDGKTLLIQ